MVLNHYYIWFLIHWLKIWYGYKNIDTAVIFAQAKHETGNFTSDIYKENNNLFGMQVPSIRKNYVTGKNRGHATYKSLFDSVRDYFLRQKNFRIPSTSNFDFMMSTNDSGYAEDGSYYRKWKNILDTLEPPMPNWVKYILMAIGVFLAWYILDAIMHSWNRNTDQKKFNKSVKKFQLNHG